MEAAPSIVGNVEPFLFNLGMFCPVHYCTYTEPHTQQLCTSSVPQPATTRNALYFSKYLNGLATGYAPTV